MSTVDEMEDAQGTTLCCPKCAAANQSQRKFCAQCGVPLWEACIQCGELCAANEKFCGACGANIAAAIQRRLDQCAANLREVEQMRKEGRFDDGVCLLEELAKLQHPQLKDQAAQASRLMGRLAAERERFAIIVEEAGKQAESRFAARDYAGAARALERLPGPLRTPPMQQMLLEAKTRLEVISRLQKEVQEAKRSKKADRLLAAIEQLLAVEPDHAEAHQLAGDVQKRVDEEARRHLATFRYEEARGLLQRIPETMRSAEMTELRERVAELAWMARELRTAPVVDPPLVAIAARLQKASPGDGRTIKLVAELCRRSQLLGGAPPRVAVPWSSATPRRTEMPIDWLIGFRRIVLHDDLDLSPLRECPGAFFVAAGLVLQGLGQGLLQINLLPSDRGTFLGRIGNIMRPRADRSSQYVWGIDLGSTSLKAVRMVWDVSSRRAVAVAVKRLEHRKPLNQAVNEVEEIAIIDSTLQELRGQVDFQDDRVCVGLPGLWVITRQWVLPEVGDDKFDTMVRYEAEQKLPVALELLVWGYQKYNGGIVLAAAKKVQVAERLKRFREAGFHVDCVQSDCLALHNFLAFEYFPQVPSAEDEPVKREAVAAVDIGGNSSNVVVASPRCVWSHSIDFGGHCVSRSLVKDFQLTNAESEQWKRAPTKAPSLCRLHEAIEPVIFEVAKEISRSLASFGIAYPREQIGQLLLLGGGACLHGLLGHMRQKI